PRRSLEELMDQAGLALTDARRTVAGIFETEFGIKPGDFPPAVVRSVEADPESRTYQFVVKAVVDDANHAVRSLQRQLEEQQEEIAQLRQQLRSGSAVAVPGEGQAGVDTGVGTPAAAARTAPPQVGIAGTFDLDDIRSALSLRIVRAELSRRLPGATIRAFAPYGYHRPTRHTAGEVIEPLSSPKRAAGLAAELDALVIAGQMHGRHALAARYGDDEADDPVSSVLADGLAGRTDEACP